MSVSLNHLWSELQQEEARWTVWRQRRKVRHIAMGIFYLPMVWLTMYFTHISYLACFSDVSSFQKLFPVEAVWNAFGELINEEPQNAMAVSLFACFAVAVLGTVFGIILRKATNHVKGKACSFEPKVKSPETALNWAKKLTDLWYKKSLWFFLFFLLAILGGVAMTVFTTKLCQNFEAVGADIWYNAYIGGVTLVMLTVVWGLFNLVIFPPRPAEMQGFKLVTEAEQVIKKEAEEARQRRRDAELRKKIDHGIQSFLAGDYEEARKTFQDFGKTTCGEVAAIRILCDGNGGDTIEALRNSYDGLWKAKDLGFCNDKVRKAVDFALEKITPVIMEEAQPDMLEIYKNYLDGYNGSVVYKCEKHVAYGHPDAIVVQVITKLQSDIYNRPENYEEFLKQLKLAKRRGIRLVDESYVAEFITELEVTIRKNQVLEEQRKRREQQQPVVPTYGQSGALSTWAEPSGWTDFRTGETLYRVEGRIVNGKGEEVSPAWWD